MKSSNNILYYLRLLIYILIIYNLIVFFQYFRYNGFYDSYNYAQYAFTYQNFGFITRGFIPSLFSFLQIKNTVTIIIIFNLLIVSFYYLFIKSGFLKPELKNTSIAYFFSSAGIIHLALDALRLDLFIYVFCLLSYYLALRNKIILAGIVAIISLFIHESSIFILTPMYFIIYGNSRAFYINTLIYVLIFISIVLSGNQLSAADAVLAIRQFTTIQNPLMYLYAQRVLPFTENINYIFSLFPLKANILFMGFHFVLILYIVNTKLLYKIAFVFFPLILCLVAIDWFRWINYVYFLLFIYLLKNEYTFSDQQTKKIIILSFITIAPQIAFLQSPYWYNLITDFLR